MNQAVAKRQETVPEAPREPTTLLEVIASCASNPQVDVEKMKALLDMRRTLEHDAAKREFFAAFSDLQKALTPIEKRGRIEISATNKQAYALWEDINEQIRPILAAHGFALNFRIGNTGKEVSVVAVLAHVGGHSIESDPWISGADTSGSKNPTQGMGSAVSYGKRYTAGPLLNLTFIGEDDDAASLDQTISEEQLAELTALADQFAVDKANFCKWANVPSLADILVKDFAKAKTAMMAKGKAKKGAAE